MKKKTKWSPFFQKSDIEQDVLLFSFQFCDTFLFSLWKGGLWLLFPSPKGGIAGPSHRLSTVGHAWRGHKQESRIAVLIKGHTLILGVRYEGKQC